MAALRWETGAIGDVKPLRFPALVMRVDYRVRGVASHPRRAAFVHGEARQHGRFAHLDECHTGQLGKLPQRDNLLSRAHKLAIAVSAFDAQHWDAPGIS
jgi:hypothetical protein